MILMIIATAVLFGYMLDVALHHPDTGAVHCRRPAQSLGADGRINVLPVCGCFIPPAGIILMTAPILLPIITAAGFDLVWFGVIVTINMEIGLITPPVGLNLFVVNAIAPDVPTKNSAVGLRALCHDDGCRYHHPFCLPGYSYMVA